MTSAAGFHNCPSQGHIEKYSSYFRSQPARTQRNSCPFSEHANNEEHDNEGSPWKTRRSSSVLFAGTMALRYRNSRAVRGIMKMLELAGIDPTANLISPVPPR